MDGWLASDDGKFTKIPAGGVQARAAKVRDDEKQGKGHSERLGERKVATNPVVGPLVRNSGKGEDFTALHVWMSKSTGLPVHPRALQGARFAVNSSFSVSSPRVCNPYFPKRVVWVTIWRVKHFRKRQ